MMALPRVRGVGQQVAGEYTATPPTLSDGNLENIQLDSRGRTTTHETAADVTDVTIRASSAMTATTNGADFTNLRHRGIVFYLNITANAGTSETLDIKLQGKCPVSAVYHDITGAALAQQTGTASLTLTVYPGIAETANRAVNDVLPGTYRLVYTVGGSAGQSFTFSVGAHLLP